MYDLAQDVYNFMNTLVRDRVNDFFVFLTSVFLWLVLPEPKFAPLLIAVWVAVGCDLLTKFYALVKKAGGVRKARQTRTWSSEQLWEKSKAKLFTYLILQILAGMSIRFANASPQLLHDGIELGTIVCYGYILWREVDSNLENLDDAGQHWLRPLRLRLKKKREEYIDSIAPLDKEELK